MKIDLSQLINGRASVIEFDEDLNLTDDMIQNSDIESASPFKITGKVYEQGDSFYCSGEYKGNLSYKCGRCLIDVEYPMNGLWDKRIINSVEEDTDDDVYFFENMYLDVSKIILDDITLNLPIQVLCNEDCAGICPTCGANLNTDECTCDEENIDPRLESLKNFFTENGGGVE